MSGNHGKVPQPVEKFTHQTGLTLSLVVVVILVYFFGNNWYYQLQLSYSHEKVRFLGC